jgi:spore germination protein (amino acid permease)
MLLKRFPGKNIVEIYDVTLGRIIGLVFSFILMVTFLLYSGIFSREFADVIKIYNFPTTPLSVLIGALVVVAAVSVFLGLETIARTAKLAAYPALFGFLLLIILSSKYFKPAHLLPLFGYGIGKTVTTGLLRSTACAEVILLAIFTGSLQGVKHIKKAGYVSLVLSGILLSLGLLTFSMIFEYTSTVEITAPIYVVARMIRYGNFFQRLDPLFLFVWVITTVIYISILFYTTISIYCKIFRIQDMRPLLIPMAVLVFTTAVFPRDFPSVVTVYIQNIRAFGNIPFFILPVIALMAAVIRKKKGDKSNA